MPTTSGRFNLPVPTEVALTPVEPTFRAGITGSAIQLIEVALRVAAFGPLTTGPLFDRIAFVMPGRKADNEEHHHCYKSFCQGSQFHSHLTSRNCRIVGFRICGFEEIVTDFELGQCNVQ